MITQAPTGVSAEPEVAKSGRKLRRKASGSRRRYSRIITMLLGVAAAFLWVSVGMNAGSAYSTLSAASGISAQQATDRATSEMLNALGGFGVAMGVTVAAVGAGFFTATVRRPVVVVESPPASRKRPR